MKKEKQKNKNHKSGFTLLELLVVVLIIGILAAIALPQYKLTVEKTKVSKYLSIGQSIRSAQERFYMANGEYSGSLSALDIDIESLCKSRAGNANNIFFNCMDKSIELDNFMGTNPTVKGALNIIYCSSLSNTVQHSYLECQANRDLEIAFYYANHWYSNRRNKTICTGYTDKGQRLCKALGY